MRTFLTVLTLTALVVFAAPSQAQYVSKTVTFDEYFLQTQNDYTIWFSGGVGYTYQMPVGPLTGYLIPPDTTVWGIGVPTYCYKYTTQAYDSCVTSIEFLYDSTAVSPTGFQRAVTIWLNPSADWNHYLITSVTHNKRLEILTFSWNNAPGPLLPLLHNHTYRLRISSQFIPGFSGWMFTANASVFDVTSGSPVLIGDATGGINDEISPTDTAISIGISAAKHGGAVRLDNFSYYGIPSSDSCEVIIDTIATKSFHPEQLSLNFSIIGNNLSIETNEDFELQIIDVVGRVRYIGTATKPRTSISLDELPAGMYLLNAEKGNESLTARFILAR